MTHILRPFNKNFIAMKKNRLLIGLILPMLLLAEIGLAQVTNPGTVVQQGATNHANNDINSSVNNSLNKTESAIKGLFKKKKKMTHADSVQMQNQAAAATVSTSTAATTASTSSAATTTSNTGQGAQQSLTSYQNYDFVPGNTIVFEDQFTDDPSGEFPSHWDLKRGQATLNMNGADKAFFITDGNYGVVAPLMKTNTYLTDNFSIEYDIYGNRSYMLIVFMRVPGSGNFYSSYVRASGAEWKGYGVGGDHTDSFAANLPADIADNNFDNKWHHIAIALKNDQMKIYVDKYRVLTVPHCGGLKPGYVDCEGVGDHASPIIFRNFKIANGAQMYMLGQKFTDSKIVTHGINFDIDQATIKPESMGTLNMVMHVLKDNPDVKFEIDGHTDNTGTAPHNLTLSRQRADAVKAQLIAMGVDASRLTSKGFGDTKPIADNTTLEGKANNRRVEFVKQ
jgi:OOP family OmpA-OmpF porin